MHTIQVTDAETNICNNLRRNNPELLHHSDWRLILAHHIWSGSADYPNEAEIIHWMPDGTDHNQVEYMLLRIRSLQRAINNLSKYNTELLQELNILKKTIEENS